MTRENNQKNPLTKNLLNGLATKLANNDFGQGIEILASTELSEETQTLLALKIAQTKTLQDPANWISHISATLPPAHHAQGVGQIVTHWTNRDFRSAAAWIGEQPQGELRELATHSFAQAVAPHEPDSAAEWASTLSPSQSRTDLMKDILKHWQATDPESAATYAKQHNLTKE